MIKQIIKQLWTERSHNGWLLLELTGVCFFLLLMADFLWIRVKNYAEPLGYDTANVWLMNLKMLEPAAPAYVDPALVEESAAGQLQTLADRIRRHPDVEGVSISLFAAPYPRGGFWDALLKDTVEPPVEMQGRLVMPEYFDVMHIRSHDGHPLQTVATEGQRLVVVTEDVAERFFGSAAGAVGQEIYRGDDYERGLANSQPSRIIGVCTRHKNQEFDPYRPGFFEMLSVSHLDERLHIHGFTAADILVRVRPGSEVHFETSFIDGMGEQLRVDNLYVSSMVSSLELRDRVVGASLRGEIRLMTYVMLFVLATAFLGVFGSFWLRVHRRQGEIGVRMAMGASRRVIRRCLVIEGLCLMAVAMLPALVMYFNLLYADVLDTWRLPFDATRVLIALVAATVTMAVFILAGTLWPARRAAGVTPVDALRIEN
jgi:putative ABC transport system permease protein